MFNSLSDFIEAKFDRINNFFEEKCSNVNNFIDRVQQEIVPSAVVSLTNKFRYDFVEMNDRYIIELEMPGISKENVEIFLEDAEGNDNDSDENVYITVVGEKIASQSNIYLRKERKYGKQSRSILLPQDCDLCMIKGKFCNNGILNITIAKKQAIAFNNSDFSDDEEPLQTAKNNLGQSEPGEISEQRHIKTITIDDE